MTFVVLSSEEGSGGDDDDDDARFGSSTLGDRLCRCDL